MRPNNPFLNQFVFRNPEGPTLPDLPLFQPSFVPSPDSSYDFMFKLKDKSMKDLRDLLRKLGQIQSGTKKELQDRIKSVLMTNMGREHLKTVDKELYYKLFGNDPNSQFGMIDPRQSLPFGNFGLGSNSFLNGFGNTNGISLTNLPQLGQLPSISGPQGQFSDYNQLKQFQHFARPVSPMMNNPQTSQYMMQNNKGGMNQHLNPQEYIQKIGNVHYQTMPPKITHECFCEKNDLHSPTLRCRNCKGLSHISCLEKMKDLTPFECIQCQASKIDPLNETSRIIMRPFKIPKGERVEEMRDRYVRHFRLTQEMCTNNGALIIQVRCIKLDAGEAYCHVWPQHGELRINGSHIKDFKPPEGNVSAKRRDFPLYIHQFCQPGDNTIQIYCEHEKNEKKNEQNPTYVAMIFGIKTYSVKELIDSIIAKHQQRKNKSDDFKRVKEMLSLRYIENEDDECMCTEPKKVTVDLKDSFSFNAIQYPARGKNCQHLQCFDLENYVKMNEQYKKWKCPICSNKTVDIVLDEYFLQLIEKLRKKVTRYDEIVLLKDGGFQTERFKYKALVLENAEPKFIRVNESGDPIADDDKSNLLDIESKSFGSSEDKSEYLQRSIKEETPKQAPIINTEVPPHLSVILVDEDDSFQNQQGNHPVGSPLRITGEEINMEDHINNTKEARIRVDEDKSQQISEKENQISQEKEFSNSSNSNANKKRPFIQMTEVEVISLDSDSEENPRPPLENPQKKFQYHAPSSNMNNPIINIPSISPPNNLNNQIPNFQNSSGPIQQSPKIKPIEINTANMGNILQNKDNRHSNQSPVNSNFRSDSPSSSLPCQIPSIQQIVTSSPANCPPVQLPSLLEKEEHKSSEGIKLPTLNAVALGNNSSAQQSSNSSGEKSQAFRLPPILCEPPASNPKNDDKVKLLQSKLRDLSIQITNKKLNLQKKNIHFEQKEFKTEERNKNMKICGYLTFQEYLNELAEAHHKNKNQQEQGKTSNSESKPKEQKEDIIDINIPEAKYKEKNNKEEQEKNYGNIRNQEILTEIMKEILIEKEFGSKKQIKSNANKKINFSTIFIPKPEFKKLFQPQSSHVQSPNVLSLFKNTELPLNQIRKNKLQETLSSLQINNSFQHPSFSQSLLRSFGNNSSASLNTNPNLLNSLAFPQYNLNSPFMNQLQIIPPKINPQYQGQTQNNSIQPSCGIQPQLNFGNARNEQPGFSDFHMSLLGPGMMSGGLNLGNAPFTPFFSMNTNQNIVNPNNFK